MDEKKDITLKDLYKLTLSMKDGLTNKIDAQKRKAEDIEEENEKLSKEVKEHGKLIRQLTARVETKFCQLQIEENRDDIEKIDDKHCRYNLIIYGIPEENNKSARDCVEELFTELGLPFG